METKQIVELLDRYSLYDVMYIMARKMYRVKNVYNNYSRQRIASLVWERYKESADIDTLGLAIKQAYIAVYLKENTAYGVLEMMKKH